VTTGSDIPLGAFLFYIYEQLYLYHASGRVLHTALN
jgi:hypothetical protein